MILSFQTDMPAQTVQTQILIRVYTVCHSVGIVWTRYFMVEPHSSNFRVITTNFLGVRIFRKFMVHCGLNIKIFTVPLTNLLKLLHVYVLTLLLGLGTFSKKFPVHKTTKVHLNSHDLFNQGYDMIKYDRFWNYSTCTLNLRALFDPD